VAKKKTKRKPKGSPRFAFVKDYLTRHPKAGYEDVCKAARKRGLKIIPIVYGRARQALGI